MNIDEILHSVDHIIKKCECPKCKVAYTPENIEIVATTKSEGLFEARCPKCKLSAVVTVTIGPEIAITNQNMARTHSEISKNEVLDMKNFLNTFDGNFIKIFTQQ